MSELIDTIQRFWGSQGTIRIVGLAGSGKTYSLAEAMLWAHTEKGVPLNRIVFVSFTRAAIQEVKSKLKEIRKNYTLDNRTTSFGTAQIMTLHSWCWQNLFKNKKTEEEPTEFYSVEQFASEIGLEERTANNLSRLLSAALIYSEEEFEKFCDTFDNPMKMISLAEEYNKRKGKKIDYNDILRIPSENNVSSLTEKIDLLLIDEAQDLTEIQWNLVLTYLYPRSKITVLAGDLTQSIYLWNGATPEVWLGAEVQHEIVMNETRRIPADLLPLINALISDESKRIVPHPSDTKKGKLKLWPKEEFAYSYLQEKSEKNEDVLVLTLTNSYMREISEKLIEHGILFSAGDWGSKSGFSPCISNDDWQALKLYYHLVNKDLDIEKSHREISTMLRPSKTYRKLWRDRIGINNARNGLGSQRWYNENYGAQMMMLSSLADALGLTPDGFFEDCFARKRDDIIQLTRKYFEIDKYFEKCYQGPYIEPKIRLSTIHGAKGLECDKVVLFMVQDRRWTEEERLKLYLNAMCRSSGELVITGKEMGAFFLGLDSGIYDPPQECWDL